MGKVMLSMLVLILCAPLTFGQNVVENPTASQTITQPTGTSLNVTGGNGLHAQRLNNIAFADQFSGSDCGAKITAALTALGGPGEVWVNQNCGTNWTSEISLGTSQIIRIIQGGTYTLGRTDGTQSTTSFITLVGTGSGITCASTIGGGGGSTVNGPCYLKEAGGANLAALIKFTGKLDSISGLVVDGNKAGQTCPSPPCNVVWIYKSLRGDISFSQIQQGWSHNVVVESSSPFSANESAGTQIFKSQSVFAGAVACSAPCGSAIRVSSTADVALVDVEAGESQIGFDLVDAGTARIDGGDSGGNTGNGIRVSCTGLDAGTSGPILSPRQLGTNQGDAISINGWTGTGAQQGAACTNGVISGAIQFITSGGTANSFDAIHLTDTGGWTITGITTTNNNGGVLFRNAVEITETHTTEGVDVLTGNNLQGWATNGCVLLGSTYSVGNSNCNSQITSGSLTVSTSGFTSTSGGSNTGFQGSGFTRYNNIPTVSNGVPAEYAAVDLTAQGGNIGNTPAYALPASGAGLYRVSIYGVITRPATTSSTLPTACVLWTDRDSGGGTLQQIFNVTASGMSNGSNTLTTSESGTITVNAKAGTSINYAFGNACTGGSAYATSGATTMQYAAHIKVEAL